MKIKKGVKILCIFSQKRKANYLAKELQKNHFRVEVGKFQRFEKGICGYPLIEQNIK